jgi:hypothetical protein
MNKKLEALIELFAWLMIVGYFILVVCKDWPW